MPTLPKPQTVVDVLHDELRRVILSGLQEPGTALTEVSVSTEYEVARPTAKAAIERLITDGLLVRGGRRVGALIPRLSIADINDLYRMRETLEIAAYSSLAENTHDLAGARAANDELIAAASNDDSHGLVAADILFHRTLVAESQSPRLKRLHGQLMSEAHLCMAQVQARQLLRGEEIGQEHIEILEAIETRDTSLIAARTTAHLERARMKLIDEIVAIADEEGQ